MRTTKEERWARVKELSKQRKDTLWMYCTGYASPFDGGMWKDQNKP